MAHATDVLALVPHPLVDSSEMRSLECCSQFMTRPDDAASGTHFLDSRGVHGMVPSSLRLPSRVRIEMRV